MAKYKGLRAAGAKNPVKTLARLVSYITRDYGKRFFLVLVCIALGALASVAGSLFLRVLIDDYITPLLNSAMPRFEGLGRAIMVMAAIYYTGVVAIFIWSRTMVTISQGVQKRIRDELFSRMQTLPVAYFDTHPYGDLMSRYTNDIDTLRQMLSQSIPQIFSSALTITVVFFAMMNVSVRLTVMVLVVMSLSWIASRIIGQMSSTYFVKQQQSVGAINGYIEEMINGQKVIKVFNHERQAEAGFDALNDSWCNSSTTANKYANILMPLLINIGNLQFVLVAVVGGAWAVGGKGALTVGAIASFLQLSRSFSMPLNQASQQLNAIIQALAGAERIFEVMDEEPEKDEGYVTLVKAVQGDDGEIVETSDRTGFWAWRHPHKAGGLSYVPLTGEVEFVDVDFGYVPEKTVLHDISLEAHHGEKIALVGSTGAGKTTITNLINRFYDIQSGRIRYDGINIEKIRKPDLRRSLGMVLQETNLFSGTIRDNIRYGRLDATDDEVLEAAKLANADGFIRLLPDGYDTVLANDGAQLSQGQRQLVSIARAAVANPPVMILDEATSSIDTRTESLVQKGMDSLMRGRTVFVIAHRLSTVRNAEMIMVMEQGRIIERGSHDELLKEKGKYYQLYTGAFELQ